MTAVVKLDVHVEGQDPESIKNATRPEAERRPPNSQLVAWMKKNREVAVSVHYFGGGRFR